MILQLAAVSKFEATEAVIGGERFLIVPAEALEGLYQRVDGAIPAEPEEQAAKRGKAPAAKPKAEAARAPKASVEVPATRAEAVRLALAEGAKTGFEVLQFVQAVGREDDAQQVSTTLCQLRLAGDVEKDASTGKWRMVA